MVPYLKKAHRILCSRYPRVSVPRAHWISPRASVPKAHLPGVVTSVGGSVAEEGSGRGSNTGNRATAGISFLLPTPSSPEGKRGVRRDQNNNNNNNK